MGQLVYPKRRVRQPPLGPVEIDWSHPLSEKLFFYSIGMQDLVSGAVATPVSGWSASLSARNHGLDGLALESHSITNGGFEYHGTDLNVIDGSSYFTVAAIASFDSEETNAVIISCPLDKTTWTGGLNIVGFKRFSFGTSASVYFNISGTNRRATSNSSYLTVDGINHLYSATKNNTSTIRFYKDGSLHSSKTGTQVGNPLTTVAGQQNIYTLSRNNAATEEGHNGRIFLAAMWSRSLEDQEHSLLYENPWAMLKPRVATLYYPAGIAPTRPALDRVSSMHFQRYYEPIAMGA